MRENNNSTQVNPTIITGVSVVQVAEPEKEYNFFAPTENDLPEDVHLAVYGESEIEPEVEEVRNEGIEETEEAPSSTYVSLAIWAGISATMGIGSLLLLPMSYFAWYFDAGLFEKFFPLVLGAALAFFSLQFGKDAILEDYLDIEGTMTKWQKSVVASTISIPILGIFCFFAPAFERQISTWQNNYEYRVKLKSDFNTFEDPLTRVRINSWRGQNPITYKPVKQQSIKTIPTRPQRIEVKPIEPLGKSNTLR